MNFTKGSREPDAWRAGPGTRLPINQLLIATEWTMEVQGMVVVDVERGMLETVYDYPTYRLIANFEPIDFRCENGIFVTMGNHPTGELLLGVINLDGTLTCREIRSSSTYSHLLLHGVAPKWKLKTSPSVYLDSTRGPHQWTEHDRIDVEYVEGLGRRITIALPPNCFQYMLRVVFTDDDGSKLLATPTVLACDTSVTFTVKDKKCTIEYKDINTGLAITVQEPQRFETRSTHRFQVCVDPVDWTRDYEITLWYDGKSYTSFYTLLANKTTITLAIPKAKQ